MTASGEDGPEDLQLVLVMAKRWDARGSVSYLVWEVQVEVDYRVGIVVVAGIYDPGDSSLDL